ncbi:MAG TPA: helix-turn-helix transcriptional regulator [Gammaproteobacteria bacterium]
MNKILELVESLVCKANNPNGKSPVKHLGFISCGSQVHIRHVPFYEPCIIMVLSGQKIIFDRERPVTCKEGCVLTVPAPGSFDLRNEPDAHCGQYRALVIPFKHEHLEQLRKMHGIDNIGHLDQIRILKYENDETLVATVQHYLECPTNEKLLSHRLSEILLYLSGKDDRLMSYALARDNWSQRVRAILSSDLEREWAIGEVCKHLAASETTLRRKLRQEDTSFREILHELRLTSGLMQLLQTSLPVYQVAYECGYQSVSRFTSNFRKRFGLAPTELRASLDEKEQKLAACERPQAS